MDTQNNRTPNTGSSEITITAQELAVLLKGNAPVQNQTNAGQDQNQQNAAMPEGGYTVDLKLIISAVFKRWWLILLATLIGGFGMLIYTRSQYTAQYTTTVRLLVNNYNYGISSDVSLSKTYISSADMMASQEIINTYNIILTTHKTLDEVAARMESNYGRQTSYNELVGMISGKALSETQIYQVTVTSPDPYKALEVANILYEYLPEILESIVAGSSVAKVDKAQEAVLVSPSFTAKVLTGAAIGCALALAYAILVGCVMNDKLESSSWLSTSFPSIPVLAQIPETGDGNTRNSGYGYYGYGYDSYGYGYGYGYERAAKKAPSGSASKSAAGTQPSDTHKSN